MTVDAVPVALGARSYEVRIGPGLIDRAGAQLAPLLRRPRVAVVTDETVAGLHLARLADGLAAAGLEVRRTGGYGRKRHMTLARKPL